MKSYNVHRKGGLYDIHIFVNLICFNSIDIINIYMIFFSILLSPVFVINEITNEFGEFRMMDGFNKIILLYGKY
jgi:hypothetical protein